MDVRSFKTFWNAIGEFLTIISGLGIIFPFLDIPSILALIGLAAWLGKNLSRSYVLLIYNTSSDIMYYYTSGRLSLTVYDYSFWIDFGLP